MVKTNPKRPPRMRHCHLVGLTILAVNLSVSVSACDDDDGLPAVADAAGGADGSIPDGGTGPETSGGSDASGGAMAATDYDVAVVRLNADGTRDMTFGSGGIARLDFGPGAGSVRDLVYSMAHDGQSRLVLFGAHRGAGSGRVDQDRVVARLTPDGRLDTTFATMGLHTLDIASLTDHARHGFVQADGKVVASGYTAQPTGVGTQSANRIVLLRLDGAGMPDATFGIKGVANSAPFVPADPARTEWGMAEAYAVREQSGKYVTTGYGRAAASGTVDMVSFRYTETGWLDTTWGTNGVVALDLAGDNDRGRDLVVLPGDRVLVAGSGTPTPMSIDALLVMLQPNGALDTTFDGDGHKLYDFGRPEEAFFGVAVAPSGEWAVAAGYRAGAVGGVMEDDDAVLALIPLGASGNTENAKAVPLSETQHDRFWAVAFDGADRIYAAGYVSEGGDNRMAVARFYLSGTLDTNFGNEGVVTVNVAEGATEEARAVVVLPDGKVVIAGSFEKK